MIVVVFVLSSILTNIEGYYSSKTTVVVHFYSEVTRTIVFSLTFRAFSCFDVGIKESILPGANVNVVSEVLKLRSKTKGAAAVQEVRKLKGKMRGEQL